jgi:uncharacterized protein YqcC (DUF446 family)
MESIAGILKALETALRDQGQWQQLAPPQPALASKLPFCYDTLEFNQWLQWVLLPNMYRLLESGDALPAQSAIHEYAEEIYKHTDHDSEELLLIIKQLDQFITTKGNSD